VPEFRFARLELTAAVGQHALDGPAGTLPRRLRVAATGPETWRVGPSGGMGHATGESARHVLKRKPSELTLESVEIKIFPVEIID